MNKPGQLRQWEFLKLRTFNHEDAEKSAGLMEADGWIVVCMQDRDNLLVIKRADGTSIIQPRTDYYREEERIGDVTRC